MACSHTGERSRVSIEGEGTAVYSAAFRGCRLRLHRGSLLDVQRRIGDWHDWHQLEEIAREILRGRPRQCAGRADCEDHKAEVRSGACRSQCSAQALPAHCDAECSGLLAAPVSEMGWLGSAVGPTGVKTPRFFLLISARLKSCPCYKARPWQCFSTLHSRAVTKHSHVTRFRFRPIQAAKRTSDKNSGARFSFLCRKQPTIALVTVDEFCFSMPRILMHKCRASNTTPTPCGLIASRIASAIWRGGDVPPAPAGGAQTPRPAARFC